MVRVRAFRTIENAVRREGYTCVAGVDEVGRGCLAGPVVAGAVALAKSAFAKKPDKTGRIAIDLSDPAPLAPARP